MKKFLLTALLSISALPAVSFAASFDCGKAATNVEKMICGDSDISILDDQLSSVYKAVGTAERLVIREQQIDWLKHRRNMCSDKQCLVKAYQIRIDQLSRNSGSVNSCYSFTHQFSDLNAPDKKAYSVTDFLKIFSKDEESITFELRLFGANSHACSIPGFAYRSEKTADSYVFKDKKKYWIGGFEGYGLSSGEAECEVRFDISDNETKIISNGDCRAFCGARAAIGGQVLQKSKNCSELNFH